MATVSLQSLLTKELHTLDCPAVVEGLFSLVPSSQLQEQTPGEDGPVVGVSVALKVEQEQAPTVAGGISPKLASAERKKVCQLRIKVMVKAQCLWDVALRWTQV